MKLNVIRDFLEKKGYSITFEQLNDIVDCSLTATQGKLFKRKINVFFATSENENALNGIVDYILNNSKPSLTLVICDVDFDISDEKCQFIKETPNGIRILHFVYFKRKTNEYIYNTNFSYYQSNNLKEIINYLISNT